MGKKAVRKVIFVLLGIILNLSGRYIAAACNLPIWLDVTGTCVAAYFAGPVGGVIAGAANNLILGVTVPYAFAYVPVSIAVGLIFSFCAKKGFLESYATVMISSFVVGLFSIAASTPLNLMFHAGKSGNMWGDALFDMLDWYGVPRVLCALAGELVVEIIDKQISVFLAALLIRGVLRLDKTHKKKTGEQILSGLLLFLLLFPYHARDAAAYPVPAGESAAVSGNYMETIYDSQSGMAASEANDIEETSDGYIWIGSYAGLTRYDGREFEFIREGGISSVTSMMTDKKGRLWVGTNDRGIARYENGSFTFFTADNGLPVNSIRSYAEGDDGTVYVGTTDQICMIMKDDTIKTIEREELTYVNSMVFYQGALIGVTNTGDLFMLDAKGALTLLERSRENLYYTCITVTDRGLMAGTSENYIIRIGISENGMFRQEQISTGDLTRVTDIRSDSTGKLWMCGENGLGYLDDSGKAQIRHYEGFDSSIECMHEDYQGNIWFASSRCGVMKLSRNRFHNLFSLAGVENAVVNAVVVFDGSYYCGTDNGLVILDRDGYTRQENELTRMLEGDRVRSLMVDSADCLWICTYGDDGLLRVDERGRITVFNTEQKGTVCNRFRCIVELQDGIMAAGSSEGINFIDGDEVVGSITEQDGLRNPQILCLTEGKDGTLYAGSDGAGIYEIRDRSIRENHTTKDGLTSDVILRMTPYGDGCFVVASNSLCYMEEGRIRPLEKFPYFNNYDVKIIGEKAYVLSSSGIYMTDAQPLCRGEDVHYKLYNNNDGLLGGLTANSWNYVDENGALYFCCNNGVLTLLPDDGGSVPDYKFGIASVMTEGEKPIASTGGIYRVPAEAKRITVKASLRNYAPNNVKLRFYIEELDESPGILSQYELEPMQISNLAHGTYTIHIQIVSDDEARVLQEKEYTLVKEAQVWENLWYRIYLIVVVVWLVAFTTWGIVMLINISRRKKELEELRQELEETVSIQTEEIREQAERMIDFQWHVIDSMASLIESRDGNTGEHVINTRNYVSLLANELLRRGMYPELVTEEYVNDLVRVAPLHDVGKIKISDVILNKPGRFVPEEYEIMKKHTTFGNEIVEDILGKAEPRMLQTARDMALYHHEKWDGSGYPAGKKGEEIPLSARIMAIADVFDALVSRRVYKEPMEPEEAFRVIAESAGKHFDAALAEVFLSMKEEITAVCRAVKSDG